MTNGALFPGHNCSGRDTVTFWTCIVLYNVLVRGLFRQMENNSLHWCLPRECFTFPILIQRMLYCIFGCMQYISGNNKIWKSCSKVYNMVNTVYIYPQSKVFTNPRFVWNATKIQILVIQHGGVCFAMPWRIVGISALNLERAYCR